jgi:hypothetical protein
MHNVMREFHAHCLSGTVTPRSSVDSSREEFRSTKRVVGEVVLRTYSAVLARTSEEDNLSQLAPPPPAFGDGTPSYPSGHQ